MAPLLPLIERMSLYPAETLLAVPASPEETLRGMLVLQGIAHQLETEAEALRRRAGGAATPRRRRCGPRRRNWRRPKLCRPVSRPSSTGRSPRHRPIGAWPRMRRRRRRGARPRMRRAPNSLRGAIAEHRSRPPCRRGAGAAGRGKGGARPAGDGRRGGAAAAGGAGAADRRGDDPGGGPPGRPADRPGGRHDRPRLGRADGCRAGNRHLLPGGAECPGGVALRRARGVRRTLPQLRQPDDRRLRRRLPRRAGGHGSPRHRGRAAAWRWASRWA